MYITRPAVREYIMEGDITKKRANWITKILEYDVDIKPTKLVCGRGLCEYIVQDCEPRGDEVVIDETVMFVPNVPSDSWIDKRKHFMKTRIFPENLPPTKRRFYRLQNSSFRLIDGTLFKRNFDGILLRCVDRSQADKILHEFHYASSGGHFSTPTTAIKIIQVGYFWPSMLKDTDNLVRGCKECQYYTGRGKKLAMPLRPMSVEEPFAQWGLDFIRMINPPSSTRHKWILTATDYFTRWSKAVPLQNSSKSEVLAFLEDLTCRYGPPKIVISDNAYIFKGSWITQFALSRGIYLKTSSSYYPQGNALAKSTNKNLIWLIKRIGSEYKKEWHHHLRSALWVDHITPK